MRNPPQTGNTVVNGITYNVKSEAKFITDDLGGEPTCGSASTQVQYLHIVTTVTSAVVGKRIPPVSVDSLVSPTTDFAEGHGALGLKIVDRSGTKGVAGGVTVTATSPSYNPPNENTDPNGSGCAVFDGIPVGAYTLTVDQPGYVGRDLNQKQTVNGTAVRKTVSSVNLQYDKAITIRGAFSTHTPGKTFSTADLKPTTSTYLSATNGINVGMLRTVKSTPPATAIDSAGLYPFTENMYAMFAGECKYASPETYISNYFGTTNKAAALFGDPSKPQPQLATVYEPPFNVRVMNLSGTTFDDKDMWSPRSCRSRRRRRRAATRTAISSTGWAGGRLGRVVGHRSARDRNLPQPLAVEREWLVRPGHAVRQVPLLRDRHGEEEVLRHHLGAVQQHVG